MATALQIELKVSILACLFSTRENNKHRNVKVEKTPGLMPVFQKDDTITVANASTINNGASALARPRSRAPIRLLNSPFLHLRLLFYTYIRLVGAYIHMALTLNGSEP
ncbi:hypothetical protein BC936DRAFT_144136 [Jimgerdemannia flammicorona]|uniref:Thiolase N-terminal domain-containing protein n=1 Tax=Jimgerdemannia flammicorona TaxID=994334 RepID=A0A432ZYL1_9FUNG|nr:hypothetical protein BC936DRAFT_144136 [Jimgerdemannia flammicorona]